MAHFTGKRSMVWQPGLFPEETIPAGVSRQTGPVNKLDVRDSPFHEWYRFVLSFPAHLVREYVSRFGLEETDVLLDPFCGTGTTLVEAKLLGIPSTGIEANPMAHFASSVKTDWDIDPDQLVAHAASVAKRAKQDSDSEKGSSLRTLSEESSKLLLKNAISPLPLHKSLVLLDRIEHDESAQFKRHELLALAKSLVCSISNLYFGPEVGVRRRHKTDAPVIESWLVEIENMAADLRNAGRNGTVATVHCADARYVPAGLSPQRFSAVFTSPPYPNEKDYTRITRLESVMLGFMQNRADLRALKNGLLRSNTRNVYKGDDDDRWVAEHAEIQAIVAEIEKRRIALRKTSGFERQYGRVTKLYFGGMARHLAELRPFLKPGAWLGYVVGDQASYLQVMIHTGRLLADIAQSLGYRIVGIDLFRTRLATATRQQIREEVVVLQWPGWS
ncbi:MAG: DNA methyltransferase [Nitrospira sp.]|nr:DNA methyltransferase [Nitrospira sp.]